ncbi:MAG: RHS repeat-associated core domain-containing protein [Bacteroidales bacterium]|nr:RHS repeat-associated core domain-containing protein [Bacteroidales bacterium]
MKNRQNINGSLRKKEVTQPQQNTEYYLFNSQGNLKAYSDDIMSFAYYGYNAANTRTYKLSLYNTNLWINGQQQPLNLQWQNAMFYPNTYLNFDAFGNYTKHYYNGTERIASRLGDNNTTIAIDNMLENRKLSLEERVRNEIQELISEPTQVDMPPVLDILNLQPTGTPNDIYYYHPNHLGSTSFVTDQNQTITQGFLYAPFGEITTEYNVNFGNNTIPKYSFNAKELDEETGMYYYEARYYAPPTFTSRDPLFEKYFWMSPYAYCANNPVKYVDPSGRKIFVANEKSKDYISQYLIDQFGTDNFIKYSTNNKLKINHKNYRSIYKSANEYQKTLLKGIKKASRNPLKVTIDIDDKQEFQWKLKVPKYNENNELLGYDETWGRIMVPDGATTREGLSDCLIFINNNGASSITMSSENGETGKSASAVFFHELLDEYLNYYAKGKIKDSSPKIKKVFYQNQALQNKGLPPRDGKDHQ